MVQMPSWQNKDVEYIIEPDRKESVEQSSPSRACVFAFPVFGGRITAFKNVFVTNTHITEENYSH